MSRRPRGLHLTDKGRREIGIEPSRLVPLLALPWRDERLDRRHDRAVTVNVALPDLDAIRAEGYHAGLRDAQR